MNNFLYLPLGVFIFLMNYMCYMGIMNPFSVSGGFSILLIVTAISDIAYTYKLGKLTGKYLKPWYNKLEE